MRNPAPVLRKTAPAFIFAIGMFLALPADAFAISLQDARAQGLVKEQADGYLAANGAPSPDVAKLITDVNSERRRTYEQVARETGVAIEAVGQSAAEKIRSRN